MTDVGDKELTVRQVAKRSGKHINTIWRWIGDGTLRAHRKPTAPNRNKEGKGCQWLVYESDLTTLLSSEKGKINYQFGRWVERERYVDLLTIREYLECSNCGYQNDYGEHFKHCPNCKKRMIG